MGKQYYGTEKNDFGTTNNDYWTWKYRF